MIEVINIKQGIPDYTACIYIGRKMPGHPASRLANPFKIKPDGDRPEALQKYREWLEEQMQSDTPARQEIYRIIDLQKATGKLLLLCWCKPNLCHGDVVKEIVEQIINENL